MTIYGDKLYELRKSRELTLDELSEKLNNLSDYKVSRSAISRWENGKTEPSATAMSLYAKLFNVDMNSLLNIDKKSHLKGVKIPVLGKVAAGIPIEAVEDIIDYEEIPEEMAKSGEFFGLEIQGNSMYPRIFEGDVVIVKKQSTADSGDIVIALINGEDGICKQLYKYKDHIELRSFNPMYKPLVYSNEDISSLPVSIIGKVVELRGKF